MDYEQLARQESGRPHDLSAAWHRCKTIRDCNDNVVTKVKDFCDRKHFSVKALEETGARVALRGEGPDIFLAWAGEGRLNGHRAVTAIKYRHLDTGKRYAEPGSNWMEPIICGDRFAKDWFVVEGETDTARLTYLVGDVAAIFCLPAGALTVKPEWLGLIPGGATVYLALDADEPGDQGAIKVRRGLFQTSIRVKPSQGKDWCEWVGDKDEFISLVRREKAASETSLLSVDELLMHYLEERTNTRPPIQLGWGSIDSEIKGVSDGQVLGIAARTAVGKTWALASVADNIAQSGVGGIVMSLEMPGVDWIERQFAIAANVSPEMVEQWAKQGEIAAKSQGFRERFKNMLFCEKIVSLDEMAMLIQQARKRLDAPLRAVFVDYLGLVDGRGSNIYERTSLVAKGLKVLAKRENVSIIVAMQLSRLGGDGTKEVTLEMLRDSGVLEESVDFLLGCWRQPRDPATGSATNVMCLRILKNRRGPDGRRVDLNFLPKSRKLVEVSP